MELLRRRAGRRQFISTSSMALGSSMLARPSGLLFASGTPSQALAGTRPDATKYGKYIVLSQNAEPNERGIEMFPMRGDLPGFSIIIIGRMLPPGPMPSRDAPEKHDKEIEYLIHLGNNPDDPSILMPILWA